MRVSVIRNNIIKSITLPDIINGSFWISGSDLNGNKRNLILIDSENGEWKLISNPKTYYIKDNVMVPFTYLKNNSFYLIKNEIDNDTFLLYCSETLEEYNSYEINELLDKGISIGKKSSNFISYPYLSNKTCSIKRENNKIFIISEDNKIPIFVNNVRIIDRKELKIGDVIFIYGLKIILGGINKNGIIYSLYINNITLNNVLVDAIASGMFEASNITYNETVDEVYYPLYEDDAYFYKKPRIVPSLKQLDIKVDEPPQKIENKENPLLLTIGPMITMSMVSLIMGYNSLSGVTKGTTTLKDAMPSLIVCLAMFASIFVWPLLTRAYQNIEAKKKERKRQKKYGKYIDQKIEEISKAKNEQTSLLKMHYLTTTDCANIILNKSPELWQRRITDDDYLTVNLGIGNTPMLINISYPEEKFTMEEDNLKNLVTKLGNTPKWLENVPIPYSLKTNYISGVFGLNYLHEYVRNLLLQIIALHSYDDLKIIILTDDDNANNWNFLKNAPHLFTDDKNIRFFATNNDEYKEICYYLNKIFEDRINNENKEYNQLYLIITDTFKKVREIDLIKNILNAKGYNGFSLFVLDKKMTNFPDQCTSFIDLSLISNSGFLGELKNNLDISTNIKFSFELNSTIDFEGCISAISDIPIDIKNDSEGKLVNKYGFLEMYDVGKVEQLNSDIRWKNNNPVLSFAAPVGIGKNGELITIDLHEKYHGPHGLIAGMTGSGKSEFIITYILSMAINYHPYEVQFVLIDYKGGGLAGAFENRMTGIKLPHLIGTITNLDTNEINRSLASIESELKRRQELFNKAREISGESTIDIYKYQKMYRQGLLSEPVSHLFIICDEFAELKLQQPSFMEQLISTARIGRSLGVHLILATQKPSGVVDPQIWSNTRFRVCLRVQDVADSNEVIKKNDAAFIKQTGRFYFQVGYDEVFTMGQAAYAGGNYYPADNIKKDIDTSIDYINNIGYIVKKIDTKIKSNVKVESMGQELSNVVKYLFNIANQNKIVTRQLWLQKLSENILLDSLTQKYNYTKENYILNPIVGEYDIPKKQFQGLLTLPISDRGNALLYGAAGSGKENFLFTLLSSSMNIYSALEVNYYILDFGSGALSVFSNSSIVGDVLQSSDEEKIENLMKMLNTLVEERKKMFSQYGGNYKDFIKQSGSSVPNIVIIINNYENFTELYDKYDDILSSLTRESYKYGIYFILTVNTPNGIKYRLKQNFGLLLSLNQNNIDDYVTIFNNSVRNITPNKNTGRGLCVLNDEIVEFQTAKVSSDNEITYIKNQIEKINSTNPPKARRVPVLPEHVTFDEIKDDYSKTNDLIIGIDKNTLKTVPFNFNKNLFNIISTLDLLSISKFINPLINQIIAKKFANLIVVNTEEFEINKDMLKYYYYIDKDFDSIIDKLSDYVENNYKKFASSNFDKRALVGVKPLYFMIIGMDGFLGKISSEKRSVFESLLKKAKDIGLVKFIIVDSIERIRKIDMESWFRSNTNKSYGIWLGNGINEQYTLSISQKTFNTNEPISNDFCIVINRGKAELVKYVDDFKIQ